MASKSAVLLLTGGPDSTTLLAWAIKEGYSCRALYFCAVGEPDNRELESVKNRAAKEKVSLDIMDVSKLIASLRGDTPIPFGSAVALSMAVSFATRLGIDTVLLGLNAGDLENAQYPAELTRDYVDKFEAMVKTSRKNMQILTPFIQMKKHEVFELGKNLGVDYKNTWSCFQLTASEQCGQCPSCTDRRKAFEKSGIPDETKYSRGNPELAEGGCICIMFC